MPYICLLTLVRDTQKQAPDDKTLIETDKQHLNVCKQLLAPCEINKVMRNVICLWPVLSTRSALWKLQLWCCLYELWHFAIYKLLYVFTWRVNAGNCNYCTVYFFFCVWHVAIAAVLQAFFYCKSKNFDREPPWVFVWLDGRNA